MASSGFQADVRALQKHLAARHLIYQHPHNKQMSCHAMAQFLSNTLYYEHFFPYYAFNVLGGLDNEGNGCLFTYDAVGSYERVGYSSQGLLDPTSTLDTVLRVLVPRSSCPFWTMNLNLLALFCYVHRTLLLHFQKQNLLIW